LNSLAAEQFQELQNSPHLPNEYRAVVAYNRAAALQKTDDKYIARQVIEMMDQILAAANVSPSLKFLASSGRLATIAARYARLWRRQQRIGAKHNADHTKRLAQAEVEGLAFLQSIETTIAGTTQVPRDELNVVMAVTLNALGQLETLLGKPESARLRYRRALTFLPSFVEASLNLAELYLEKKGSLDSNWATRAERLVIDTQKIDPNNTRGQVLLGTLYANPVFGRIDKATAQLTQALPDPTAGQWLAGIYFSEGKPADAIAPLLSALAQDTSLGSGHLLLARCALALDPADRRRCELLRRADSAIKKLAKGKGGSQYQQDAQALLPKIAAAMSACV
jgi:tetratricopeptide (TPR) repeat protein